MPDWRDSLKVDPIPGLLSCEEPAVRWWTLRDLLDLPSGAPRVTAARKASRESAPARAILAAQGRSGAWAKPAHLYSPKHTATTWQLDILADLGFTAADEGVRRACDLFFAWQLPTGAVGLTAKTVSGEACSTGRSLCQWHRFGLGGHKGAHRAWEWLTATQRADGGWHCRPRSMQPRASLVLAAARAGSCLIASMKVLEAGVAAVRDETPGAVRPPDETLARAAAFVHGCLLVRNAGRYASPTLWDRLVYPNHWYDAASVVDALTVFGYDLRDPQVAAAVSLITSLQGADGMWRVGGELAFHGSCLHDFGATGRPSPWVSLRAARAIKRAWGAAPG